MQSYWKNFLPSSLQNSLQLYIIPSILKDSVIVHVAKIRACIACYEDLQEVFQNLNSVLLGVTLDNVDPLQVAGRGVEEAICTLLHTIHSHLDGVKNIAFLLFIDF